MSHFTTGAKACNKNPSSGGSPQFIQSLNVATNPNERSDQGLLPHSHQNDLGLLAQNSILSHDETACLGNYAESSPTREFSGFKPKSGKTSVWDFDAALAEKFALQMQARKAMLEDFYSVPEGERPKKPHRVCNCRRDLRPVLVGKDAKGKNQYEMTKPQIFRHGETGHTFYGGLMTCGSAYACAVCSTKINEVRAAEIRSAVSQWVASGGICLFVTLTFPHYREDSFESLMKLFKQGALKRFREGREYESIKSELGYFSFIRSIEVTWGEANGWHPHSHEIWFVKPDFLQSSLPELVGKSFHTLGDKLKEFVLEPMKLRLYNKWRNAVVSSGLSAPSYERGINLQVAETEEDLQVRLADYFTKTGIEKAPWGVDDEMTRHNTKKGKEGRFTPFDFLRNQFDPRFTKSQKARFLKLFAEYVRGFKGTAKIYWASGLKDHFNIADLTDEAAAEQQTEIAKLEYEVPPPIWVFVVAINDHRAELLLKVKNEGVQAAKEFLSDLLDRYAEYLDERYDELPKIHQYILESYDFNSPIK